jgi:hypothetical protein
MSCGGKMAFKKHPKTDNSWIKKAVPASHKGRLHKALGVPEGEKLPASKLASAANSSNPHMRKMANFAKTMKKL